MMAVFPQSWDMLSLWQVCVRWSTIAGSGYCLLPSLAEYWWDDLGRLGSPFLSWAWQQTVWSCQIIRIHLAGGWFGHNVLCLIIIIVWYYFYLGGFFQPAKHKHHGGKCIHSQPAWFLLQVARPRWPTWVAMPTLETCSALSLPTSVSQKSCLTNRGFAVDCQFCCVFCVFSCLLMSFLQVKSFNHVQSTQQIWAQLELRLEASPLGEGW